MSRVVVLAFLVTAAAVSLAPKTLAQGTPGQINDPSTYRGSMANQAAEQASSAQVEAQNQQMLQRMDQNYAAYAPKGRGGGGGGPPPKSLKSYPLLAAAKNPLLGMWRMGETQKIDLNPALNGLGVDKVVTNLMGGGCESVLGKPGTVIRFTPTQLNWVAPDGHDEILNHVEYHANGSNVIVIPTDSDLSLIFGMPSHDNAVVALFGCTLARTNTAARVATVAPSAAGSGAGRGPAPGAGTGGVAVAAGQAILKLTVGEVINGRLNSPPAGTRLFLTNQNPDQNLVRAGFNPPAGGSPVDALFAACNVGHGGVQERCAAGLTALAGGALGTMDTDINGQATSSGVAPGRYYVVGFTPYKGHSLIWHMPLDLKAGTNAVSLTPENGSVSH